MRGTSRILALGLATLALVAALSAGCSMIQGKQSPGEYVDDKSLTASVKAALLRDDQVKAMKINVDTYNGVVTLTGFADSAEMRERAEKIAGQVPGVKDVKSAIHVAGGSSDGENRR
jgi:osmotically-inducible protein OsmY